MSRRAELESSDVDICYNTYDQLLALKRLKGYKYNNQPMWGDRFGIYHPLTSQFTFLDKPSFALHDQMQYRPISVGQAAANIGMSLDAALQISKELEERYILLKANETKSLTFVPDYQSQAEVYVETTEACNLSCAGCATGMDRYVAGQAQSMTPEMLRTTLTRCAQSAYEKGIKSLRFKWAGGESLIPKSARLIEEAQVTLQQLRDEFPDVKISQVILTNGTWLTPVMVDRLKTWGTRVSISLWGIGNENDIARGARRDQDKYRHIVSGIQRVHEAGIGYNINHVVTPNNADRFKDFLRTMWDTEGETFLGKDWKWPGEKKPIPLGINFFRGQTAEQISMMNETGYDQIVNGVRGGFDVIRDLIDRNIPIQPLERLDYLNSAGVIPSTCGSGFNYLAVGPRGASSCHEGLFSMQNNVALGENMNLFDLANSEFDGNQEKLLGPNIKFGEISAIAQSFLALHGGAGCPRTSRDEHGGELGYAASSANKINAQIMEEWLALEGMRRQAVL